MFGLHSRSKVIHGPYFDGVQHQQQEAALHERYATARSALFQLVMDLLSEKPIDRPDSRLLRPITPHHIGTMIGGVLINSNSLAPNEPIRTVFDLETRDDVTTEICTHGVCESENKRYRFENDGKGKLFVRVGGQHQSLDGPLGTEAMTILENLTARIGKVVVPRAVTIG